MTTTSQSSTGVPSGLRLTTILFGLALIWQPAQAHDFWIQPTSFRPLPGNPVGLTLRAGESLEGDDLPRNETLQDRFVVVGPKGESPIAGIHGVRPAGVFTPREPGMYVIGYTSHGSVARLTAAKFDQYLTEEGLGSQLSEAVPSGRLITDGFSRSAKSLLRVPGGATGGYDAVLGLPLELVLLDNPNRAPQDARADPAELELQLLYQGQPAPGILIRALHRDDPARPLSARTDFQGRVALPIGEPGLWLIKAVRIEAAGTGSAVDYHSQWASLTLEFPEDYAPSTDSGCSPRRD